jgi:pimeloyl-ACP methyl ester carboxylesterase
VNGQMRRPIKRMELSLGVAGLILILLGTHWIRLAALPKQTGIIEEAGCRIPVTVLSPPDGVTPAGSVVLIHGLSANRRLMTYLGADFAGHGFRAYLFDLPGHGDNKDAFTFASAQQCMNVAVASLIRRRQIDPGTTIVVGHSLGGATAIRMADVEPVAATIAISPVPLTMPQRMPSNLLVLSAQFDIGAMKKQAESLMEAAGGTRTQPEDFAQKRAFQLQRVPLASHTTIILDRTVAHRAELWAMQTVFPNIPIETLSINLDLATYGTFDGGRKRLAGSIVGVLGILLMFPLALSLVCRLTGCRDNAATQGHPNYVLMLLETAVCAFVAVWILAVANPLGFLHLYTGEYLASLLLIVGLLLLLLNWKSAKSNFSLRGSVAALVAAIVIGFALILAVGGWANWQIDDAWLNAPRWLRFAELLPVMWLYCFAEETVLGKHTHGKDRWIRFLVFLSLRLELWLVCVLAYFELASGQAMVVILLPALSVFSILQRLGTDAISRYTDSALGASVFNAILAAWFLAAVFPLT